MEHQETTHPFDFKPTGTSHSLPLWQVQELYQELPDWMGSGWCAHESSTTHTTHSNIN